MRFVQILQGIGSGPFDGIIMKIAYIVADQQVFACYIETTKNARGPEADGRLKGKARDRGSTFASEIWVFLLPMDSSL